MKFVRRDEIKEGDNLSLKCKKSKSGILEKIHIKDLADFQV